MNNEKTQEFIKLVAENPDLPVVPLVDYDVTGDGDDCAYYIAKFSKASVDEYILEKDDGCYGEFRQIFYRSEAEGDPNEIEIVLSAVLGYEKIEGMTDAEMKKAFDNLPWIKAILVHIGVPTWEVD